MTCQKTVAWMKEKGIYDRWLTPINFDKQFGRHANRPPGSSPELMPWQGGQFTQQRSERRALLFHSCLTHELHEDDDLKFSLSAPNNRMTKAFRRILKQGWPSSKLVIQDGCRKSIGRWPSRKFQLRRGRRPGRTSEAAGDDLLLSPPPTNLRYTGRRACVHGRTPTTIASARRLCVTNMPPPLPRKRIQPRPFYSSTSR